MMSKYLFKRVVIFWPEENNVVVRGYAPLHQQNPAPRDNRLLQSSSARETITPAHGAATRAYYFIVPLKPKYGFSVSLK